MPRIPTPEVPAIKIFRKRSREIYRGMQKRAAKGYSNIPFTYAEFVHWLMGKFFGWAGGLARCEYSGEVLSAENFFVDHRTPISRSGSFGLENLEVCSKAENLRKGEMTEGEYKHFRHFVTESLPEVVQKSIWRRLEVGDVQRFAHFRRQRKRV